MLQLARISILCAGLLAGAAATAHAELAYHESLVHDTTTPVEITLDPSTVLCSAADYSGLFLKIGIPQLAALTLLDHQNIGANAPCVAAGSCQPGNMPSDLIDPDEPTEVVNINVQAFRGDETDSVAQTCQTYLVERVKVVVRGVEFTHERIAPVGSRPFVDCVSSAAPAPAPSPEDEKTDAYGTEPTPGAGCSATRSGTGSLLAFAIVGLVGALRRRNRR